MKSSWRKKWAPNGKRMIILLVALLILDLALLVYLSRKPLCIESRLFSELEWVFSDGKVVTAYNCDAEIKVPLAAIFVEKLPEIQRRISQLDGLMNSSFIPLREVKLTIYESTGRLLQVSSDRVKISEPLFFDRNLDLEKAYVRAWIQQFQKGTGLGLLRLEVLTQFLMWNLGVSENAVRHWQPILGQWPQFATSWSGYCQSPIKDQIFEVLCLAPTFNKRAEALTPFSQSFWLAQKLWQSFQVLPVKEQMTYFSRMSQFVSALSEAESQSLAEISLIEMEAYARREAEIWQAALERIGFRDWGWNFASKVKGELDANKDSLGQIDLFIKTERNWTAEELQDLQDFAIKEVNYRVIGDTPTGLWSFPWIVPLKLETFPSLKAQNLVLSTCEMPTLDDLLALKAYADKVILVKDCEPNPKPLIYSGLLHRGLQFFSLDNKDTQFIQINLEALQFLVQRDRGLSSKKLVLVSQTSDRKNKLALIAGWSSVPWNPKYRAYEVNETIDLVEWFKLPENIWPDLD